MNSKPTILVSENRTVFQAPYLEDKWEKYFNIEILDIEKHYNKRSTVVVSDWTSFENKTNVNECIVVDKGFRHIIDHCWDSWDSTFDNSADFTLRPKDFIRINESIWYRHLGYEKLKLTSNTNRDFLLLMNAENLQRTKLYNRLTPILKDNIYSYVEYGIPLQNAQDQEWNSTTWQRYIDPFWYNSTRFSIVAESLNVNYDVMEDVRRESDNVNVSEKTLKPCAFKHPSIIWGQVGTLSWQKRQGFETFDHCIDETYDTIKDENLRFEKVIEQINLCIADKSIFTDPVTQQKLEYNYNHFYNEEIVSKLFKEQMVDPLLEFIE